MIHAHRRQPAVDQAPHPVPRNSAVLAAVGQRPLPESAYFESERVQRVAVHGHTRPAPSPVNASTPPSRAAPHVSGTIWIAIPLPYETFIHYTSPVLPAHKENRHE
jgi:hypothetical protein